MQRIGILEERLQHGVARLVVGHEPVLILVTHAAALAAAELHLVASFLEIDLLDIVLVGHRRGDRGFIDDRSQIRTAKHRRAAGHALEIDLRRELDLLGVNLEDLHAALEIRQRHHDLTVKATRTDERGIEHILTVRRGDDDHAIAGREAVHLDQNRVERLFTLVVSAGGETTAAATADGIDFIQEDDAGRRVLGLLEEVAHAACAHADEHLHEVRAADREEGHIGLARDGLGQEGLAAAGFADEEHAAGDAAAQTSELLGVLEELDDLGDFFLGLFNARHIGERDARHFLVERAVARLAEVAQHAPAASRTAHRAAHQEVDEDDQQNEGTKDQHELRPFTGAARDSRVVRDLQNSLGHGLA